MNVSLNTREKHTGVWRGFFFWMAIGTLCLFNAALLALQHRRHRRQQQQQQK